MLIFFSECIILKKDKRYKHHISFQSFYYWTFCIVYVYLKFLKISNKFQEFLFIFFSDMILNLPGKIFSTKKTL